MCDIFCGLGVDVTLIFRAGLWLFIEDF